MTDTKENPMTTPRRLSREDSAPRRRSRKTFGPRITVPRRALTTVPRRALITRDES